MIETIVWPAVPGVEAFFLRAPVRRKVDAPLEPYNGDGARAAGDFAGTELEGAKRLDGTLFIRAAGLTANVIGWLKEGQKARDWDRSGFY